MRVVKSPAQCNEVKLSRFEVRSDSLVLGRQKEESLLSS